MPISAMIERISIVLHGKFIKNKKLSRIVDQNQDWEIAKR